MKGGPIRCDFQPLNMAGRTPSISAACAVLSVLVIVVVRQNFRGQLSFCKVSWVDMTPPRGRAKGSWILSWKVQISGRMSIPRFRSSPEMLFRTLVSAPRTIPYANLPLSDP